MLALKNHQMNLGVDNFFHLCALSGSWKLIVRGWRTKFIGRRKRRGSNPRPATCAQNFWYRRTAAPSCACAGYPNISPSSANVYTLHTSCSSQAAGGPTSLVYYLTETTLLVGLPLACCFEVTRYIKTGALILEGF